MDWVEGPILRSKAEAETLSRTEPSGARSASAWSTPWSRSTRSTPTRSASASWRSKEDYVARQLRRWQGQWQKQHTRELPLIDDVHDRLAARIPEQGPATIVHGDYRLDNMILTAAGEVAAVVDWELCTLGDPLADVGLLLVYWGEEGDDLVPLLEPATMAARFSRAATRSASSTPSAPAATSPRSTSTSRSGSGSSRSCSRASSPATPPASTATPSRRREGDVVERLVEAAAEAERRLS